MKCNTRGEYVVTNPTTTYWKEGVRVQRISEWRPDGYAYFTTSIEWGPSISAHRNEVTKINQEDEVKL